MNLETDIKNDRFNEQLERKHLFYSVFFPFCFVFLLSILQLIVTIFGFENAYLGVWPRDTSTLYGIFTMTFIHANFGHLYSNSVAIIVLWGLTHYFYNDISWKVVIFVIVFGNTMLWIAGRPAWHIGASGLVYGLASFVFVSGFIRRNIRMIAISLLVVFLYGGMIWHMFPIEINDPISWEGHLFGAIGGSISALYFRNLGPTVQPKTWPNEDEFEEEAFDFDEENEFNDDTKK